jgi:hypothetical protein
MTGLSAAEIASMRATVESVALSMRCTIERFTDGEPDEYGQPTGFWDVLHNAIPCLYWVEDTRAAGEAAGPDAGYVLARTMVQLAANVDVHEGDRVASVIGVDGTQIAGPADIEEVRRRITDTVLVLEEVS